MSVALNRSEFGKTPSGDGVEAFELVNERGVSARIITLGACLQSCRVPDFRGGCVDIVLGFGSAAEYLANPRFFGGTIGRLANRIAGASFKLDGQTYRLACNDGLNSLHGGEIGFDKVVWEVLEAVAGPTGAVVLRYVSPDGAEGYPGSLIATATFTLNHDNVLSIQYRATADRPTVVNITNHTYWTLAGEGSQRSALDLELTLPADCYLPIDSMTIPTGEFRSVAGTPFDFRAPTRIRTRMGIRDEQLLNGHGYDHTWVIDRAPTRAPRLVARVEDPQEHRTLEVFSNQAGVQFYSGNFFEGTYAGKSGTRYCAGDAIALEPAHFPNTPNEPRFGSVRLSPGEVYENVISYRFR